MLSQGSYGLLPAGIVMLRVDNSRDRIILWFIGTSCIRLPLVILFCKPHKQVFGTGERANAVSEECSKL